MAKIRVAVLFGGVSSEHDVSLISAENVIRSIPKDKYEVLCIGITKKGRWLYFPSDITEISTGAWEQNPDCSAAILSPDPLHGGIITIENGETYIKKGRRCLSGAARQKRRGRQTPGHHGDGTHPVCGLRRSEQCCVHG